MSFLGNLFSRGSSQAKCLRCPAIFIPGSSAGKNRFDLTFKMMGISPRDVLKLVVGPDRTISTSGRYTGYVVVAFSDNQDGYENINRQAELLDSAFAFLAARYPFKEFNAVGHSNGGLNWTIFLERYFRRYKKKIRNLVTIGTPFNLSSAKKERTRLLQELAEGRDRIPRDLAVHAVAGLDDWVVPSESAHCAGEVFEGAVKEFTVVDLAGPLSHHTLLPHNLETVNLLTGILAPFKGQNLKIVDDLPN